MQVSRVLGFLALTLTLSAHASTTLWDFDQGVNPIQGGGQGNFIEMTIDGVTMTLTGWSETINSSYCDNPANAGDPVCTDTNSPNDSNLDPFIDEATLGYHQNGQNIGILNDDPESGSPQHSIDNIPDSSSDGYNDFDMVLAQFSEAVTLSEIYSGWEASSSGADISVVAYTGLVDITTQPFFSNTSTWFDLLSQGWQTVGNYVGVQNTQAISTSIESKYWLVGAYNPSFNGAVVDPLLDVGNDGFKLGSITTQNDGTVTVTSVSEPGSAGILVLGSVLLWIRLKRKA